jgi:hypothetical protein
MRIVSVSLDRGSEIITPITYTSLLNGSIFQQQDREEKPRSSEERKEMHGIWEHLNIVMYRQGTAVGALVGV